MKVKTLLKFDDQKLNGFLEKGGVPLTAAYARLYLTNCLNKGKLLLPVGKCETFDYKTGCPGH